MLSRKSLGILIVIALAGLSITGWLVYRHVQLFNGEEMGALCDTFTVFNCDAIEFSNWSELFSIPTATFGFSYFASILILSIIAMGNPYKRREVGIFLFFFSLLATLAAIALTLISHFDIGALCLYCLVSHSLTLLTLIVIWMNFKFEKESPFKLLSKSISKEKSKSAPDSAVILNNLVIASVVLLFSLLSGYAFNKPSGESVDVSKFMAQFENLPKFTVDPGDSPKIGLPDAKIKIVEFSDFQCPACKAAFKSIKPVIRKYKDKIHFTYKHFPLDMSCNDLLKNRLHPAACDAAAASMCVKNQTGDTGFFKYHDELFHNQNKLSRKYIEELAHKSVPDKDKWNECFNSSETLAAIRDDIRLAKELGVQATPTLFVNGRRIEGALTRKQLEALIDHSTEIN